MKKGVMQFLLLCLVAFAHTAKADLWSFTSDVIPGTGSVVTFTHDDSTDIISNIVLAPGVSIYEDSFTFAPELLLDDEWVIDAGATAFLTLSPIDYDDSNPDARVVSWEWLFYLDVVGVFDPLSPGPVAGTYFDGSLITATGMRVSAVPVPAALPLMASALGLFGFAKRRRSA